MTSDLRVGDPVRVLPTAECICDGQRCLVVDVRPSGVMRVRSASGDVAIVHRSEVEPLPPDVPRQAVEDLLAAVEKRAAECDSKRVQYRAEGHEVWAAEEYVRHTELRHIARCLRKLLGGES